MDINMNMNMNMSIHTQEHEHKHDMNTIQTVSLGIEPGSIVFPSQNNNIVLWVFGVLQAMWN
jgi:hypothetical protein